MNPIGAEVWCVVGLRVYDRDSLYWGFLFDLVSCGERVLLLLVDYLINDRCTYNFGLIYYY